MKIISTNLILCLIVYALFEVFSGDYIIGKNTTLNNNYLVIDKPIEYDVDLYTKKPIKIKYKRDQYGFKDRFKNVDSIDIIAVGGSTTEQRYLAIENTWPDLLEKKFNNNNDFDIDIINAGISGQSSEGHIWSLNHWFKNIKDLKPQYIIFYMGINENENVTAKGDPQPHQLKNIKLKDKIKKYLKNNNGITYKIYLKFTLKKSALLNVWHDSERYNSSYKLIGPDASKFKKVTFIRLEKKLEELSRLTNEIGARPIFVTQKTLRWKKDKSLIYSIDNINHYFNEKKISKVIIDFCIKKNIKYIDGFNKLKFIKEDTWDLVHTSPSGSEKIADLIYLETKSILHKF